LTVRDNIRTKPQNCFGGFERGQRLRSALLPVGGCFGVMGMTSYSPSCANPALNTSSRTRYGRIVSFLNSRVSEQNWQFKAYIPPIGLSLILRDVPMKWSLWHFSQIMPMWIGMADIGERTTLRMPASPDPAPAPFALGFRPSFLAGITRRLFVFEQLLRLFF
jgi:hypothetical protein